MFSVMLSFDRFHRQQDQRDNNLMDNFMYSMLSFEFKNRIILCFSSLCDFTTGFNIR